MKHFFSSYLFYFRLGVLGLLFVLTGLGCKGLSQEELSAVAPITLNYWTVYSDTAKLREFADAYKQIRPYVTINVRQVRADIFDDTFVTALADDVGPDIISLHVDSLRTHVHRLRPMPASVKVASVATKGSFSKETVVTVYTNPMPTRTGVEQDYVSAVAEDVIVGGNIYGLPLSIDTLGLYYNRQLLDRAGVPEPPTTWEEFLEAVRKTTRYSATGDILQSGVALGTGENISNSFDILSLLMMQNGITMSQGNQVSFSSGIEALGPSHPSLQALRFYTDFARVSKDVYSWNEKQDNAFDAFVRGKTVFYFGYARDRARIVAQAPQMDMEVIPVPQLRPDKAANVASYSIESVVAKSKHPDEAWDFIRFLSSEENIRRYAEAVGQPSPLRAHIVEKQEDPVLGSFVSQLLWAKHWYRGQDIGAAKKAFSDLMIGYLLPYPTEPPPEERDANLLIRAAQVVQQTY